MYSQNSLNNLFVITICFVHSTHQMTKLKKYPFSLSSLSLSLLSLSIYIYIEMKKRGQGGWDRKGGGCIQRKGEGKKRGRDG